MLKNILQATSRVEAPFIEVDIGGFVFGKYSKKREDVTGRNVGYTRQIREYFPNFVKSLNIVKINGTVNTYTLTLVYVIQPGDDPNKIDKVISSVATSRKMIISYGDYNTPSYVYKEEEAMITTVKSNVDMNSSSITYTISAVSTAKLATQNKINEPGFFGKPSEKIKEILNNQKYGLLDIFYGMRLKDIQNTLIAGDDKAVQVDAKINVSTFDYLNYLVACMTATSDTDSIKHRYVIICMDDLTGSYGGPYFQVIKVANNVQDSGSLNAYELTVGFPDADAVTSFTINEDDAYSLLYNFSEKQTQQNYTYTINDQGLIDYDYAPSMLKDDLLKPSDTLRTWWSQMTQYPISVTVTVKGLLRPAILMTYLKLNVYFYGRKHSSSGTYIITQQQDQINEQGYRTTLSLTRIQGESL